MMNRPAFSIWKKGFSRLGISGRILRGGFEFSHFMTAMIGAINGPYELFVSD
jgi:hypothetical protein